MHGTTILEEVFKICLENELICWVDGGTLLGAVRESNFLENETDLDFGVMVDQGDFMADILSCNGFSVDSLLVDDFGKIRNIKATKRKVHIDIATFARLEGFLERVSPRAMKKAPVGFDRKNTFAVMQYRFRSDAVDNLDTLAFKGVKIIIPKIFDEYLSVYYRDWRVKQSHKQYFDEVYVNSVDMYSHHHDSAGILPDCYLHWVEYKSQANE